MNDPYYIKTQEKVYNITKDETFVGYESEIVEDPTGTLVEKTITENGEYLPSEDNADGYSKVTVEVPSSGLPVLFAPVVTGGFNEISWANNPSNGDFDVTLTADVDGTPVTSPLTITQAMDGKMLTITASATNFQDGVTQISLSYLNAPSLISMTGYSGSETRCRIFTGIRTSNNVALKATFDGTDYTPGNIYKDKFSFMVDIGNTPLGYTMTATNDGVIDRITCGLVGQPYNTGDPSWGETPAGGGGDVKTGIQTINVTIYKNDVVMWTKSGSNRSDVGESVNISIQTGDVLTFIYNIAY